MPDHAPELGHRRAVRDLQAGMRRPVGHEPHRPRLAIRRQHRLQDDPVVRDDVRRQVRDAVRQHRPDEVDRLAAGSAQLDPLRHAAARRSSAVIAQRSSRPADVQRRQIGPAPDGADDAVDLGAGLAQQPDALDDLTAGRDDILDHDDHLAGDVGALDGLAGPVRLGLLADERRRETSAQRDRRRQRDRAQLEPRDDVRPRVQQLGHPHRDRLEQGRVRLELVLVEVLARDLPGAERELPSQGRDLRDPPDDLGAAVRRFRIRGHEHIVSRTGACQTGARVCTTCCSTRPTSRRSAPNSTNT